MNATHQTIVGPMRQFFMRPDGGDLGQATTLVASEKYGHALVMKLFVVKAHAKEPCVSCGLPVNLAWAMGGGFYLN